ncbi:hypothetical protein GE21DRAFT_4697 [Neurospora crassa]|uniref:Guanine nucleotide-exchange factor SEC12 n=1 Tax=Neurospora crassa (strain ATCC 24698 / 74-OR23-1A / CBS 708.71 / DSM 1257 / FGSC 987) TaxID=367110 RepID=Q7RYT0_NEUCR|nr:hypothetical protein NCU00379 [Neurospora crassa OR74A]EAA28029.1 hypothetical protein NCU00379 [Neurospora crassa OR74A]KHE87848.1 hypothetical protein GE21DRAFT_4697 [Neurospora crassa]|eukprot:XP_957265.1 hypothetical protein NCU00379 [Neurospora crassa OR74A]
MVPIPSAELRTSYSLYSLEFDPEDANRLIVAGGGGPGNHGVGNKITAIDASRPDTLDIVSEIELSRDEDSVATLVVGPRNKDSILLYAGVNSSAEDVAKGKNEHFRVFSLDQPSKAKASSEKPNITELSRTSLFATTEKDTYQRVLRLSAPFPGSAQVGAVATGFSKEPEIALFDVPNMGAATPKLRGNLELVKEAVDMDIIQTGDDSYQLAYCDEYEMRTMNIGKGISEGPKLVFTMPDEAAVTGNARPSFRSVRYLTPDFLLAVANLPKGGGVVLHGFRMPKNDKIHNKLKEKEEEEAKKGNGSADGTVTTEGGAKGTADETVVARKVEEPKARLCISAKLPSSVTRATGLAVRNLSPPASPTAKQGDAQFVIAVTGQDSSITIYTLDHQSVADINLIVNLFKVTTFKNVHNGPISGVAFSYVVPPADSNSDEKAVAKKGSVRPEYVKLASIGSVGNSCIVHSLPLKKFVDKTAQTRRGGAPRAARYVLALKSQAPSPKGLLFFTALITLFIGIFVQSFLEIKGYSSPMIGARRFAPVSWQQNPRYGAGQGVVGNVNYANSESLNSDGVHGFLASLLADKDLKVQDGQAKKLILNVGAKDGIVQVSGHDAEVDSTAPTPKEWDELHETQKKAWKEKLKAAGHWGEGMGETIFKNILFGELGAVVGGLVR